MRGSGFFGLALLLALSACSPPRSGAQSGAASIPIEESAGAADVKVALESAAPGTPISPNSVFPPGRALPSAPLLAYAYSVGLEASAKAIPSLLAGHQAACKAAGNARCQVINASTQSYGVDQITGQLEMRAEPLWLEGFRAKLADDAKAAGGRVTASSTESEDLTREIVDVSARLAAQRALRDRLQRLLESRPGKLSELLEVERELARVQGELDGLSSNLAVMQARVATSRLTLQYASRASAVSSDSWAPLRDALNGFFGTVVGGFALLIRLVAALLPFALVLGPLGWFGLRAVRRWRAARQKKEIPAA